MNDIKWMKLYKEALARIRRINELLERARESHELAEGVKKAV